MHDETVAVPNILSDIYGLCALALLTGPFGLQSELGSDEDDEEDDEEMDEEEEGNALLQALAGEDDSDDDDDEDDDEEDEEPTVQVIFWLVASHVVKMSN